MKKLYQAPMMEEIALIAAEAVAEEGDPNSWPYNDGELGWT